MLSQKFKNNKEWLITVLIVAGIIVALNYLASNYFWRIDLTKDKLYSTSTVTKETVAKLEDIVTVRLYFSSDLPNEFQLLKRQLMDVLSDYQAYSHGKFQYYLIDPKLNNEADKVGIPKIQFNQIKKDKFEVAGGYMGLTVSYRDKQELIPLVQDLSSFEYQLTSIIKKLSSNQDFKIGILQSHGSLNQDDVLKTLSSELNKIYDIEKINLTTGSISDEIDTLIIPGSKENFSDEELKKIDKFIISGRGTIVLQDGYNVITTPVNFAIENKTNLISFLSNYGLTIEKNMIADVNSGTATYNQGMFSFNVNYPLWPKVTKENFNQNNGLVAQLDSVILPWTSSLKIDDKKIPTGSKWIELAKSSKRSWELTGNINLSPDQKKPPETKDKSYLLATSFEGRLKSQFNAGEVENARLIVFGGSSFIKDDFIKGDPNNLILIQNLVDGLTLDSSLSEIRSKNVTLASIKNLSDQEKQAWRLFNIFGMTIIVFGLGVARFYWRKKTKTLEL